MVVSHHIETRSGWSIKNFVGTAPLPHHENPGGQPDLTAADPLPDDLRAALIKIRTDNAH